jgi:hypothetical protein
MKDCKIMIDEYCYIGYKWKGNLKKITSYTHKDMFYKYETNTKDILECVDIIIACETLKMINVIVYKFTNFPFSEITGNYKNTKNNLTNYINDDNNKKNISKYDFKIIENENIFTVMDNNYNILKKNDYLESDTKNGYIKSQILINTLLYNFIENT